MNPITRNVKTLARLRRAAHPAAPLTRQIPPPVSPMEALEGRKMMSVSVNNGAVTVVGTNNADDIVVEFVQQPGFPQSSDWIKVRENGAIALWRQAEGINKVTVNSLGGNDTVSVQTVPFGVTVNAGTGNDTVYGSEVRDVVDGGGNDDTLYGNGGGDDLKGGAGNDKLVGGAGNDALDAGYGDDTLDGGLGADTFFGSLGVDTADYSARTEMLMYLSIDNQANDGALGEHDNLNVSVENVIGGQGADVITGSGYNNRLEGNGGNDVIYGGTGNDDLWGYRLNSTSPFSTGQDKLFGENGADTLHAGRFSTASTLDGGANDDKLYGGEGADWLQGGAGNDTVYGYGGADSLYGGQGTDKLFGGAGEDTIVTIGGGYDEITGGADLDSYWSDVQPWDKITDESDDEVSSRRLHEVAKFEDVTVTVGLGIKTRYTIPKELNGQNLPDPGAGFPYANYAGKPLFAGGTPLVTDINQGQTGDCWVGAAVSSLAKVDPDRLRQAMVDLGDGTFAARFYDFNGDPHYYRVDADLPTGPDGLVNMKLGPSDALWGAIFEKAYAFAHSGDGSYDSLNHGWMEDVNFDLGMRSNVYERSDFGKTPDEVIHWFQYELDNGFAVTMSTLPEFQEYDFPFPQNHQQIVYGPVYANHAYMVDHVTADGSGKALSITLRNPWGFDGSHHTSGDPNDGLVTLTPQQLFNCVNHGTAGLA